VRHVCVQGCGSGGTEPALDFKIVADTYDGSRSVTANMIHAFGGNMTDILDLQVSLCAVSMRCLPDPCCSIELRPSLNNSNFCGELGTALQGFSHSSLSTLSGFHDQYPHKPIVSSECCR
jgi:hypothetical protein